MCRVSLDIVALALFTSYRGVVSEPRGIRISRCVFKYCCGVEFPSILRKIAPFFSFHPGIAVADSGEGPGPHPLFLVQTEARRAEKFFLRDRRSTLPPPPLSKGLDDRPPPPPYLRAWMTDPLLPVISRCGSGIVYWLKATHCWGNHCSCAPLPPFTFIYLCELTTILVNFSWET